MRKETVYRKISTLQDPEQIARFVASRSDNPKMVLECIEQAISPDLRIYCKDIGQYVPMAEFAQDLIAHSSYGYITATEVAEYCIPDHTAGSRRVVYPSLDDYDRVMED